MRNNQENNLPRQENNLPREGQTKDLIDCLLGTGGISFAAGAWTALISTIVICPNATNTANAAIHVGIITGYVAGGFCGVGLACSAAMAAIMCAERSCSDGPQAAQRCSENAIQGIESSIRVVSEFSAGTIQPLMERMAGVFSNSASATYSYLSSNRTDNNVQPGTDQPNSNPSATGAKATPLSQTQSQNQDVVLGAIFPTNEANVSKLLENGGIEKATSNSGGIVELIFTENQLRKVGLDPEKVTRQADGSIRVEPKTFTKIIEDLVVNQQNQSVKTQPMER
jgi:hypothetical protein